MEIVSRRSVEFFSNTEVWLVRSSHIGDMLRVCISGPEEPVPSGSSVGAVYITDTPWYAGTLVNTIRCCNLSGELPSLYAISIGYPLDHRTTHAVQRARDLTPTARSDFDLVLPLILGSPEVVSSGSADAFLAFLIDELRPALEAEFPIVAGGSTLVGASFGGLFVLHTLLSSAESFRRYLSISPSLWWDDRLLLRRAEALVACRSAPRADVYMCAGELEGRVYLKAQWTRLSADVRSAIPSNMLNADVPSDMREMATILSRWNGENFRVDASTFSEESHNSIGGAALSRGLRTLYGSLAR